MNDEYGRMRSLLERLNISFTENGYSNAEVYAYSKGIELVKNQNENTMSEIFINLDSAQKFERYASLLNIDASRFTDEELKAKIIKRLSMNFGDYTKTDFDAAFEAVGSGSFIYDDELEQYVFSDVDIDDFSELAKFIEGYFFMLVPITYDGTGMSWDSWESWGKSFNYYDKLHLPLNIIDNLRSDMLE